MADQSARVPRVLGLTGAIGCGKTTAGDVLLRLGALERVDADTVVHELMAPGTAVTEAIVDTFGADVLRDDGGVNRSALAAKVFADPAALRKLEAITHPAVRAAIRRRLEALKGQDGVVILDAVKLLQSDLLPLCDTVWVVRCSAGEQRRRLTAIRGMTAEAAEERIAAQPSFDHPRVTRVIENTGSLGQFEKQIEGAWRDLNRV